MKSSLENLSCLPCLSPSVSACLCLARFARETHPHMGPVTSKSVALAVCFAVLCCFSAAFALSGATWGHLGPSGAIWAIWGNLGQPGRQEHKKRRTTAEKEQKKSRKRDGKDQLRRGLSKTCLISEREAHFLGTACRHMSSHAATCRCYPSRS